MDGRARAPSGAHAGASGPSSRAGASGGCVNISPPARACPDVPGSIERASLTRPAHLPRPSTAAAIANALAAVVALEKKSPKVLRTEQIRAQLKMEAKEMPRVLKERLLKKSLKSKGRKRSTTYSVA